jgi:hypothetical protein
MPDPRRLAITCCGKRSIETSLDAAGTSARATALTSAALMPTLARTGAVYA